jgi:hypothetical protein
MASIHDMEAEIVRLIEERVRRPGGVAGGPGGRWVRPVEDLHAF